MIRSTSRPSRLPLSAFALLAVGAAACNAATPPLVPTDGGADSAIGDGSSADTGVVATSIGPAGGTVGDAAGAQVTVPAGALSAYTIIVVAPASGASADPPPALPANVQGAGATYALLPHGTTFAIPATIHVPFDAALAARAKGRPLKLFTAAPGGAWTAVTGARVGATAVDADVMHFSFFIVGFEVPGQTLPGVPIDKLDLLFMVDNSRSMQPLQSKLVASFPSLVQALKALPGGLPDLHLGVVSSSLGVGPYDADTVAQCFLGGDGGRLQWMPRGTCATGGPTDHYIAAGAAESTKNYAGTIEQAFTCIAALGDEGCGFEQSLESMAVALGARGAPPPENAGFLRPDAALALVMITNEDDCSAGDAATVFDPTSRYVSDPHGPLTSYRCNEYGHLCAGKKPPRTAADGVTEVELTDCRSAEDGALRRVSDYATLFKGLKTDPARVFLSVIAAAPTPYKVTFGPPTVADDPARWPSVAHSCLSAAGEYGDPAVRLSELATAFGANGSFSSICDDFAPALTGIGASLVRSGARCLQADVVQAGATPQLVAGCAVSESVPAAGGTRQEAPLAACGAAAVAPCWSVKGNAACAGSAAELSVTRVGAAPAGTALVVRCTP